MSEDRRADEGPDPEAVDRLVDAVLAGEHSVADADDEAASLARLRALATEPLPDETRSRHLAHIRQYAPRRRRGRVAAGARVAWPVRMRRGLVPVAVMSLVLMLLGGTVAVAQDAVPDDPLYGVKRASEQAWVSLPRGSERAAEVQLVLAERRLGEAWRAPEHAERLVAEGLDNVESAEDELPEEAIAAFERLLGGGEEALPPTASPVARAALHRNCVRIAAKHDLSANCGPEPTVDHPGLGPGVGPGAGEVPRGWGPGGRPEGVEGPPPNTPAFDRHGGEE